ncbi:MAG: S-adenosylmethionine:tRNA ribosyltransferase-isomerase [Propionibacteriales bacterium]|nr:S-adenosylmethionine:tRNA ribosyltransferase-isomerase [Propionibacteriales bacterium]
MSHSPGVDFTLPAGSEAAAPPERCGLGRDGVRLLVAREGRAGHHLFRDLPDLLRPGDLLVVNTSATLPAAVEAVRRCGQTVPLHFSTWLDDGDWVVEPRRPDGTGPLGEVAQGETFTLPAGVRLRLHTPYPGPDAEPRRLWRATPSPATSALRYFPRHGRPIRYGYVDREWPLSDLQTVYADQPGGAEMPSAGRPFTERLLVRLMTTGVAVAPLVLHPGVSSPESHEPPTAERFAVPHPTARQVNTTRAAGGRLIAVGTTVVRALETVADRRGRVYPRAGWTDLVLGPDRPARVVDGLITGLHAPEATHLLLLEAVAGTDLVSLAYDEAVRGGYLWHEFGDSMLLFGNVRSGQRLVHGR